jgi:hypothetical protein
MSAIRKLAAEAADNGLLAPELAAGIARVKMQKHKASVPGIGCRCGRPPPWDEAGSGSCDAINLGVAM